MSCANAVLVCPRNDAESCLIHLIAQALDMTVITSTQGLGARLEDEPILETLVYTLGIHEVWIVEIPGPEVEERLRDGRRVVRVIDHHEYGPLDRSRGPNNERLKSSLEQFLELAKVSDEIIEEALADVDATGDARTVRGLGIFDGRYVEGLRDEGYSPDEVEDVLSLRNELLRLNNPKKFQAEREAARNAWRSREQRGGYTIVRAQTAIGVRPEVGILTISDACDTEPLIVIEHNEGAVFVQNVGNDIFERLNAAFGDQGYNIFTFGGERRRCWGTDSKNGAAKAVPLLDIYNVLGLV